MLFTPHLAPMNRGHPRHLLRPARQRRPDDGRVCCELLRDATRDEPFVVVTDGSPSTKATLGSQRGARHRPLRRRAPDTVVAICAIDNLAKGASGGAVQSANVALGLDETPPWLLRDPEVRDRRADVPTVEGLSP